MKSGVIRKLVIYIFILFVIGRIPFSVYAQEYYSEGYFQYTIQDDTIRIHLYFGQEKIVVIPTTIAEKQVIAIDDYAFAGNSQVESVTIPEYVTEVGEHTFEGAKSLKKIISRSEKLTVKEISDITIENDYPRYVTDAMDPEMSEKYTTSEGISDENNGFEVDDNELSERKGLLINNDEFLLTVDDSHNLIEIGPDGEVKVIDRKSKYSLSENDKGEAIIVDEKGNEVSVDADGVIKSGDNPTDTYKMQNKDSSEKRSNGNTTAAKDENQKDAGAVNTEADELSSGKTAGLSVIAAGAVLLAVLIEIMYYKNRKSKK